MATDILGGLMRAGIWAAVLFAACAAPAFADPCEGELPKKAGTVFSGKVSYVVEGDGFCLAPKPDPKTWIEVRMVDFDAPELGTPEGKKGKEILQRAIMGREATCTVTKGRTGKTTTYDRVLATCSVAGSKVSVMLKAAGAPTGGN